MQPENYHDPNIDRKRRREDSLPVYSRSDHGEHVTPFPHIMQGATMTAPPRPPHQRQRIDGYTNTNKPATSSFHSSYSQSLHRTPVISNGSSPFLYSEPVDLVSSELQDTSLAPSHSSTRTSDSIPPSEDHAFWTDRTSRSDLTNASQDIGRISPDPTSHLSERLDQPRMFRNDQAASSLDYHRHHALPSLHPPTGSISISLLTNPNRRALRNHRAVSGVDDPRHDSSIARYPALGPLFPTPSSYVPERIRRDYRAADGRHHGPSFIRPSTGTLSIATNPTRSGISSHQAANGGEYPRQSALSSIHPSAGPPSRPTQSDWLDLRNHQTSNGVNYNEQHLPSSTHPFTNPPCPTSDPNRPHMETQSYDVHNSAAPLHYHPTTGVDPDPAHGHNDWSSQGTLTALHSVPPDPARTRRHSILSNTTYRSYASYSEANYPLPSTSSRADAWLNDIGCREPHTSSRPIPISQGSRAGYSTSISNSAPPSYTITAAQTSRTLPLIAVSDAFTVDNPGPGRAWETREGLPGSVYGSAPRVSSTSALSGVFDPRSASQVDINLAGSSLSAGGSIGSNNNSSNNTNSNNFQDNRTQISNVNHYNHNYRDDTQTAIASIRGALGAYVVREGLLSKNIHGDVPVCYQGTRENVLRDILTWVGAHSGGRNEVESYSQCARCIVGAPGSGKSTIMNTLIIDLLHRAKHHAPNLITAHYSIRRAIKATTDQDKVLTTIVDQLVQRCPKAAKRVSEGLEDAYTGILANGFSDRLFLSALSECDQVVFVIIDALDEADKPGILAASLSRIIRTRPSNMRLLLATRNENGVLANLGNDLVQGIAQSIPTEESIQEVHDYIAVRLKNGVKEIFGDDRDWSEWPDETQLLSLSNRADGLYIWGRTAADFILSRLHKRGLVDRDQWIADVGRVGMADVNALYELILTSLLEDEGDEQEQIMIARRKEVFGLIILAETLLKLDDIIGVLGFDDFDISHFVKRARSILVPHTGTITGETVPQMHKTLVDYITSPRAGNFRIYQDEGHRSLFCRTFETMTRSLRFNIYNLKSSFLLHQADTSHSQGITKLPNGLSYACNKWVYHLRNTGQHFSPGDVTLGSIRILLYEKLLFWLEVVIFSASLEHRPMDSTVEEWWSLMDHRLGADKWLNELGNWLTRSEATANTDIANMVSFTRDASLLIQQFQSCILASIPHLYISFLAFSPKDSAVARHYRSKVAPTITLLASRMTLQSDSWNTDHRMADEDKVMSIAFSPSSRHLVAGYWHLPTIRVWDVETGLCVRGPLTNHKSFIRSLSFAPNGLLFASGSFDGDIYVWDWKTGRCALGPLKAECRGISASISFSPDSTRIASSFGKNAVCIWDAGNGDRVLGPLVAEIDHYHAEHFHRAVVYSPDGLLIASGSGSSDSTRIQLWDTQTGELVLGPLRGHREKITSIAFAPDSRRLVSGSSDSTIRVWDTCSGDCTILAHYPRGGYRVHDVHVCFSPDGLYVASAFQSTICIRDADTGGPIASFIGGCGDLINTVAYSPDGKYLAAGSGDGTVRLWDVTALMNSAVAQNGLVHDIDSGSVMRQLTDQCIVDAHGWTLGPHGELLFWAPRPYNGAICRPSTARILGRPSIVEPDISRLVTGEEWLDCWRSGFQEPSQRS